MPVGVTHVYIRRSADFTAPVDAARLDENILGLAAMRAGVHPQRAADRAWDAAIKGQPIDAGIRRSTRELHVGNGSAGAQAIIRFRAYRAKSAAAEANDDTRHTAVADDQVRAEADRGDGSLNRKIGEKISEVFVVGRRKQKFGPTADAKPSERRQRLVRGDTAAQFWQTPREIVGRLAMAIARNNTHAPSPIASWPGSA